MVEINPVNVRFMTSLGVRLINAAKLTDSTSYADKCALNLYTEAWENRRSAIEDTINEARVSIPEGQREFFNALQLMKWKAASINNGQAISELQNLFGMSAKTATLLAECGYPDPAFLRPKSNSIDDIVAKTREIALTVTRKSVLGIADAEQLWAEVQTGVVQMAQGWGPGWQGSVP